MTHQTSSNSDETENQHLFTALTSYQIVKTKNGTAKLPKHSIILLQYRDLKQSIQKKKLEQSCDLSKACLEMYRV